MATEYTIKRTGAFWEADVFRGADKVAHVSKGDGRTFVVSMSSGGGGYLLDPKVDGKIEPFSMIAHEGKGSDGRIVLKMRNHVFSHNGQMYLMKNVPEGSLVRNHSLGTKYITRLVNFPFKSTEEIDVLTNERLGRHRGIKVGEMSGLGIIGHKVRLESELEDIGVPLSVASYLIYASG